MSDISAMLMGGAPSAKFEDLGDEVKGTLVEEPRAEQQTDFTSREPKFWKDGSPAMQIILTVQTDLREDEDDDGLRRIYVKSNLQKSLASALRAVKEREPKIGGYITVKFSARGKRDGNKQPPKLYDVTYVPPEPDASQGDDAPF